MILQVDSSWVFYPLKLPVGSILPTGLMEFLRNKHLLRLPEGYWLINRHLTTSITWVSTISISIVSRGVFHICGTYNSTEPRTLTYCKCGDFLKEENRLQIWPNKIWVVEWTTLNKLTACPFKRANFWVDDFILCLFFGGICFFVP